MVGLSRLWTITITLPSLNSSMARSREESMINWGRARRDVTQKTRPIAASVVAASDSTVNRDPAVGLISLGSCGAETRCCDVHVKGAAMTRNSIPFLFNSVHSGF